jgi:hypothetical protein
MRNRWIWLRRVRGTALASFGMAGFAFSAVGQSVALTPRQLDRLVARIALYPDPLLAQVLTAATYPDQIPDAATWADEHENLHGDALSNAAAEDSVPWDPSVVALLPFPTVLDNMSSDMAWTRELGNAVLSQHPDVMDAVQRMRARARDYGYLQSNPDVNVVYAGGFVSIVPVRPAYVFVPVYNPAVVFVRPAGPVVVGAVVFGPPLFIAPGFVRYGWAGAGFAWRTHAVLIDRRPWGRTFANRGTYVHPYSTPWVRPRGGRVVEHHQVKAPHEAQRDHDHH